MQLAYSESRRQGRMTIFIVPFIGHHKTNRLENTIELPLSMERKIHRLYSRIKVRHLQPPEKKKDIKLPPMVRAPENEGYLSLPLLQMDYIYVFAKPSECDTRSFKRSVTGLNSEFSFSKTSFHTPKLKSLFCPTI